MNLKQFEKWGKILRVMEQIDLFKKKCFDQVE